MKILWIWMELARQWRGCMLSSISATFFLLTAHRGPTKEERAGMACRGVKRLGWPLVCLLLPPPHQTKLHSIPFDLAAVGEDKLRYFLFLQLQSPIKLHLIGACAGELRLFTHKLSQKRDFSSSLFISALRFARITVIILFNSIQFIKQLMKWMKWKRKVYFSFEWSEWSWLFGELPLHSKEISFLCELRVVSYRFSLHLTQINSTFTSFFN